MHFVTGNQTKLAIDEHSAFNLPQNLHNIIFFYTVLHNKNKL